MKHILFEKRNKLYYQVWKDNKNFLTMEDCAGIFNCPLKTYYRIINKEQKRSGD